MIDVIHADALDVTADTFAACNTLIVDPPYGAHVHANAASMGTGGRGARKRDLKFGALTADLQVHIAQAAGRVRRWSCIFSDFESIHTWRAAATHAGAEYIRVVPWVRWSQPQLSGDRPCTGAEAVSVFHARGAKHWNGPGSLTHFSRRCLRGADKHPTEKPLDLMLDLVSWFSDPGELVLDLCAGAGTTALAARLLGRQALCVELDATWAAAGAKRACGPLAPRDADRAREWCITTVDEAERVPAPSAANGSDVKTWERAKRRIADAERVARAVA